jgi:hypothetical protein
MIEDVLTLLSQPVTGLETPDFSLENYLVSAVTAAFIPGGALLRYGPGNDPGHQANWRNGHKRRPHFFRDLAENTIQQKTL